MASTVVFQGGPLILPDAIVHERRLVAKAGRIVAIEDARKPLPKGATVVELRGKLLAPGFVDLHVHGGDGADFMDGTVAAVQTACRVHLRHGTTTLFPTTTTGSPAQLSAMHTACQQAQRDDDQRGSRIAGVHFYGPYFAADKVGCHRLEGQRPPDPAEYRQHFATGIIRIATCAAELPGAVEFYRYAKRRGCLVTCGHSNSTWTEMAAAFRAGMRHVDHFWCAMSSVASLRDRCGTPMQGSMEQFVLAEPEMSTEVLADGCHLAPELLRFAYQMKGVKRLCLVTDSSRALDQPAGRYRFGNCDDGEWFENDGEVGRMIDGSALASSVAGMDHMVRTMARATGAPLPDVIRMASLTPTERAGIAGDCGSLEVGKRADLVVLTKSLKVHAVFRAGQRSA